MLKQNNLSTENKNQFQLLRLQKVFECRTKLPLNTKRIWRIDRGIVRTFTEDKDGKITTLGFWSERDIVGQPLSRLETYQIECLTTVQVTKIPLDYSCLHNALLANIWESEKLLSINNQYRVINRLWDLLDWLGSRFGQTVADGTLLDLHLTHQSIAETINTTRVQVTKLLSKLEQNGTIRRSGRDLILKID